MDPAFFPRTALHRVSWIPDVEEEVTIVALLIDGGEGWAVIIDNAGHYGHIRINELRDPDWKPSGRTR